MPGRRVVRTEVVRTTGSSGCCNPPLWLWAVVAAAAALFFTIIALATSGWGGGSLIGCGSECTDTIVLCCFGLFLLVLGILTLILFAQRLITSFSTAIKLSSIILLTLGAIFIVSAYMSRIPYNKNNYSFYLTVTASIFAFLSSIIAAFWFGKNWITV